jgi:RNA polymerase-binding transcription factor DksA
MIDTNKYKDRLNSELVELEKQLETVGRKNPSNPSDWEAVEGGESDVDNAEDGDVAEAIESLDNNSAILDQLEPKLNEVKLALEKIDNGSFGKCEICGNEIEDERLEVNPAAKTCKSHMD